MTPSNTYILIISVPSITFPSHPLFSQSLVIIYFTFLVLFRLSFLKVLLYNLIYNSSPSPICLVIHWVLCEEPYRNHHHPYHHQNAGWIQSSAGYHWQLAGTKLHWPRDTQNGADCRHHHRHRRLGHRPPATTLLSSDCYAQYRSWWYLYPYCRGMKRLRNFGNFGCLCADFYRSNKRL